MNSNLYKFSSEPLTKAQEWALGGGLAAGGAVALKQLLHALFSKKYRKNYSFTKGLRNILLGGLLGSGAGYGLNKGISNYIVHSLKFDPYGYGGNKMQYLKPDGFDTLLDSKSSLSKRKDALIKTLKDVWYRTTTTPNLENLRSDYKGDWVDVKREVRGKVGRDETDLRQELLARTFGVFDKSKGTAFRNLTKDERNILKTKFPGLYKYYANRFGAKNLLSPTNKEQIFPDPYELNRLNNYRVFDIEKDYSNVSKDALKTDLYQKTTYPSANVLLHYGNHLSDDYKDRAYTDIWDYEPHSEEIKPIKDELNSRFENLLKKRDFKRLTYSLHDPHAVVPRYILSKLLVNPIPIMGTEENNMELRKKWEDIYKSLK